MNENEIANIIQNLNPKLYRTAYLYLGNEDDALNAVDAAVYRGLLALEDLRHPEHFDTYLMRIVINECKNKLEQKNHNSTTKNIDEITVEQFDILPLREAVLKLPSKLKEPLILRYFSGLTISETAQVLKIPQKTTVIRLQRALKLLKIESILDEEVTNEPRRRI